MEPFRRHIFVCTQAKPEGVTSCPRNGAFGLLQVLERELLAQGLDDEVQVTTCGCLGLCDDGPIMIVYPEATWYRRVRTVDVREIVESHLRSGKTVERIEWNEAGAMKKLSAEHRDRFRAMMKAKDKGGVLPDDLNETIRGFMRSRVVLTALELDVFTAVARSGALPEVAGQIGANPRATEMLLNALVSLKLLVKDGGNFSNTPTSARFFTEGSPDNARTGLLHAAHLWHRWSMLTESVRTGTAVAGHVPEADWTTSFIAAMDRNAKERAAAVVQAVEDNGFKKMLDLGGGSGAYSIAFARKFPQLQVEILDVPEVVPLTQDYVRKAGLADRITARTGDMLRDSLGSGYDLVLVSAICHMFSPEQNRDLFRRVCGALAPQGKIIVQDFILEPDKTAPQAAALFSLNMLVGTQSGSSYSEPEYADWLRDAGFKDVRRVRLPGPSGLMIGLRS